MSEDRDTSSSLKLSIESKKSKSPVSSSKSKKSNKVSKPPPEVMSDDISLSQLDLLANKKKLAKRGEVSVSQLMNSVSESQKGATKQNTADNQKQKSTPKRQKASTSISSISSDENTLSEERDRRKTRNIQRENKNESVRKEKSELLYRFSKMNVKGKWSSLTLDMNCSLDEIKNEYTRVKNEIQSERSVAFLKRMLLLGVQGIEMLNTRFDPIGVDLDGWSEAMGYSLENQDYDEVMAELYEKYKGAGQMSPETKLIFMIISSATMFTITKKISKLDSSNAFTSIISNFVGQPQPPPQQPIFQETEYQIPAANELRRVDLTETTEDPTPSKLKGPNNIKLSATNEEINNILKQMEKQEKNKEEDKLSSDIVFKSIPLNTKKKGRPKKQTIGKNQ